MSKKTHGGKRKGSGRPNKYGERKLVGVKLKIAQAELIERFLSQKNNKDLTFNEFATTCLTPKVFRFLSNQAKKL